MKTSRWLLNSPRDAVGPLSRVATNLGIRCFTVLSLNLASTPCLCRGDTCSICSYHTRSSRGTPSPREKEEPPTTVCKECLSLQPALSTSPSPPYAVALPKYPRLYHLFKNVMTLRFLASSFHSFPAHSCSPARTAMAARSRRPQSINLTHSRTGSRQSTSMTRLHLQTLSRTRYSS